MHKLQRMLPTLLLAAVATLTATAAFANTAANTEIVNRAQLSYNGDKKAESSVIVTVGLVPATPNVEITRADAAYTGVNTPAVTNTVTITSTANGPANYTVAPNVTSSTNTAVAPAAQPSVTGGTTVAIGASVTTGVSGTTYVTVPASGATGAAPASINGIAVGETIVFTVGATTYAKVVSGFTDNGNGTYKISWTSGAITVAPPAGTQVGERYQVQLTATPGTIFTQGADITTTVQAVVSSPAAPFGGAPAPANATATTTPPNKWTSTNPNISFQKYSRNVFNSAGNSGGLGGTSITINASTNTYYTGGVTGKPGDTIEYVIKAKNNGALDITSCAISDQLPVAYVSDPQPAYGGAHIFYIDTNNATFQVPAGAPGAQLASYVAVNSPNLIINVGVGATGSSAGVIPPAKSVTVAYQLTIR